MRLPHDAMIATERSAAEGPGNAYFPGGTWEYQKHFTVPSDAQGRRMFVEFEGVYRDASVWVNGSFVVHHPYGYTGFTVAIDHLVRCGEDNEIRVEVQAQEDARWYSGAGIYRNVHLVVGDLVHFALDSLYVTTPEIDDEVAVVQVAAVLEHDGAVTMPTTIVTDIVDDRGAIVASETTPLTSFPRESAAVRQRVVVRNPRRWSVDDPTLYRCRVVARDADGNEVDRDETAFGIRTLQLDATRGLQINSEVVKLRGACIHHDNGVIGAATVARADERRIEILKAAGFNAIRSAHHPASTALLDACDRIGMLVMDEAFDMWHHPKMRNDYSRVFSDWWETRRRRDGTQGPQPPERHPLLHRQRDPRHRRRRRRGCRAASRRAGARARRHAVRHQRGEPAHRRRHPDHPRDGGARPTMARAMPTQARTRARRTPASTR